MSATFQWELYHRRLPGHFPKLLWIQATFQNNSRWLLQLSPEIIVVSAFLLKHTFTSCFWHPSKSYFFCKNLCESPFNKEKYTPAVLDLHGARKIGFWHAFNYKIICLQILRIVPVRNISVIKWPKNGWLDHMVIVWLATCARKSTVPGSNPVASCVQRWALCSNYPANV